ncbi:MAG: glycosyltransferase, partial [Planctomycetaceae bacterium]
PLHARDSRPSVPFPFDQLDGRPLVYASMGTLQTRLGHVFSTIARACDGLGVQLVLSRGGSEAASIAGLPDGAIVVEFAPQLDLLERATLTITHAGLNTTMESLMYGVPLIAVPITNDQPGVAARVKWTGTGDVVPLRTLSARSLRRAMARVLHDESYRRRAAEMQAAIARSGGVCRAAEIVEQAVATGKPVLRNGI